MKNLRTARNLALSITSFALSAAAAIGLISILAACGGRSGSTVSARGFVPKTGKKTMQAFSSEDELRAYLRKLADERKREAQRAAKNAAQPAAPMATTDSSAGLAKAADDAPENES